MSQHLNYQLPYAVYVHGPSTVSSHKVRAFVIQSLPTSLPLNIAVLEKKPLTREPLERAFHICNITCGVGESLKLLLREKQCMM